MHLSHYSLTWCPLFTETITEPITSINLTLVENHYPAPQSSNITLVPAAASADRPIPTAPPSLDGPPLSSLPELAQVGSLNKCNKVNI